MSSSAARTLSPEPLGRIALGSWLVIAAACPKSVAGTSVPDEGAAPSNPATALDSAPRREPVAEAEGHEDPKPSSTVSLETRPPLPIDKQATLDDCEPPELKIDEMVWYCDEGWVSAHWNWGDLVRDAPAYFRRSLEDDDFELEFRDFAGGDVVALGPHKNEANISLLVVASYTNEIGGLRIECLSDLDENPSWSHPTVAICGGLAKEARSIVFERFEAGEIEPEAQLLDFDSLPLTLSECTRDTATLEMWSSFDCGALTLDWAAGDEDDIRDEIELNESQLRKRPEFSRHVFDDGTVLAGSADADPSNFWGTMSRRHEAPDGVMHCSWLGDAAVSPESPEVAACQRLFTELEDELDFVDPEVFDPEVAYDRDHADDFDDRD